MCSIHKRKFNLVGSNACNFMTEGYADNRGMLPFRAIAKYCR